MTGGSGCYLFKFEHRNSHSCIEILSDSRKDVLTHAQRSSVTHTVTRSCPDTLGNMHSDRLAQSPYFWNPRGLPRTFSPSKLKAKLPTDWSPRCQTRSPTSSSELSLFSPPWHFPAEDSPKVANALMKGNLTSTAFIVHHLNVKELLFCFSRFILFCFTWKFYMKQTLQDSQGDEVAQGTGDGLWKLSLRGQCSNSFQAALAGFNTGQKRAHLKGLSSLKQVLNKLTSDKNTNKCKQTPPSSHLNKTKSSSMFPQLVNDTKGNALETYWLPGGSHPSSSPDLLHN